MAFFRQESDQPPAASLRVVGMRAKDNHAELASLCLPDLAGRLGNQSMYLADYQFLSLRSPGGTGQLGPSLRIGPSFGATDGREEHNQVKTREAGLDLHADARLPMDGFGQ